MVVMDMSIGTRTLAKEHEVRTESLEAGTRHFADGLNFYKLFWIFTFGSLFGFCVETLWGFVRHGELLVRSSMIIGPFNFIYGLGAIVFFLTVRLVRSQRPVHIMLVGMAAGTLIEHGCSFVQEAVFGTVSWDYSNVPLNIGGRVCLLYTFFWGVLALIWAKRLQPGMEQLIAKIPDRWGRRLTWALLAFFIVFSVISLMAVYRWTGRVDGIPAGNSIAAFLDRHFTDRFMETVYNNMIFLS